MAQIFNNAREYSIASMLFTAKNQLNEWWEDEGKASFDIIMIFLYTKLLQASSERGEKLLKRAWRRLACERESTESVRAHTSPTPWLQHLPYLQRNQKHLKKLIQRQTLWSKMNPLRTWQLDIENLPPGRRLRQCVAKVSSSQPDARTCDDFRSV